ncbi:MAG: glycine-rich protein [Bdellovibrionota bacterium]
MISCRKHGLGTSEVLIGLIIASFAAFFVMQSYNSQSKQQELAQFRVQMSLTQNEVFALLNKYERSYWASQIATDPLLAACFNGQGSNCDTSFSSPTPLVLSNAVTTTPGSGFSTATNSLLNGLLNKNGGTCNSASASCFLRTQTSIQYDCSDMLCSRGIINFNLSIDKSLLNDSDKKLFANIRDLSLEITHEKFKSSGILRTLASSCVGAAQSLSYGNGQFGCVDSSSTTNDLFDPSFGFRLMNGKLGLAGQSGGTLIPGGSTGGGSGGGTTGGSSSSTSSGGPNECPPSYISEMGEDGNLICKPVSLYACGAEKRVFTYSGAVQSYKIFKSSNVTHVRIKAWGAAGGAGFFPGAAGGYAEGILALNNDTQFAIVVGEGGKKASNSRTFGGGGAGSLGWGGSGGGLSGVFLSSFTHANSLVIAGAGGGSSGGGTQTKGIGGGLVGGYTPHDGYNGQHPMPGTQSAGGVSVAPQDPQLAGLPGSALSGGDASPLSCTNGGAGGGGAGYFGGSGGVGNWCKLPNTRDTDGAGGSSYLISSLVASSTLMSNIPPTPSDDQVPPKTSDLDYILGIGTGSLNANGSGGNGLVVMEGYCAGNDNAPIAFDDQVRLIPSSSITTRVVSNDFDADGDLDLNSLAIIGSGPSVQGTCSPAANGSIRFQSSATFTGSSFCDYKICDQKQKCTQARLTILADPPPVVTMQITCTSNRATPCTATCPAGTAMASSPYVISGQMAWGPRVVQNSATSFTCYTAYGGRSYGYNSTCGGVCTTVSPQVGVASCSTSGSQTCIASCPAGRKIVGSPYIISGTLPWNPQVIQTSPTTIQCFPTCSNRFGSGTGCTTTKCGVVCAP